MVLSNAQKLKTPIVFLHGWGGNIDSFLYFAKRLSIDRTCILVDFPPFGLSSSPTEAFSLRDYTNIVLKLLKKLKINRVCIVAHSFGGRVAIDLASNFPSFVEKLVLTGSAGLKKKSFSNRIKIFKYKFLKYFFKNNVKVQQKLKSMGSKDYLALSNDMKKTFINITNFDQKKQLKKILCPVLLVWGKNDKETPFYFTKIFKKNIKYCKVISLDDCSHFAYLEEPSIFLLSIQTFL